MRRFLLRLLIFSLVLAVPLKGAQRFWAGVVRGDQYRPDAEFWAGDDSIYILVIGDSHARNGFDTRRVEGSYSLTSSGENLIQSFYRLRAILSDPSKGPLVSTVVIPFEMHSFSSYKRSRFPDMVFWDRYVDWREVGKTMGTPWGFWSRSLVERAFPYAGNWRVLQSWLSGRSGPELLFRKGFLLDSRDFSNLTEAERVVAGLERAEHHFQGHISEDPVLLEYFDRILLECRNAGVEVLLVAYPVSRDYLAGARDSLGVDPTLPGPHRIAAEHGLVPVEGFLQTFVDRPELFADPDHLNQAGAAEFTDLLMAHLGNPGQQKD